MPILFEGNPGRVVRLDDPAATCQALLGRVGPDEARINYDIQNAIVTRMTVSEQVNVQFLHTFGRHVYIYVFGDRIGQVSLSGLAFNCSCDLGQSGAELMYAWYRTHKASKRQGPITVAIGTETIAGFVVGFTEDVVDPKSALVQWGVNLVTLPEV